MFSGLRCLDDQSRYMAIEVKHSNRRHRMCQSPVAVVKDDAFDMLYSRVQKNIYGWRVRALNDQLILFQCGLQAPRIRE